MTPRQTVVKRLFDLVVGVVGLVATSPILLGSLVIARIDTKASGLFRQPRVGRHGRLFQVVKVRTMRAVPGDLGTITASGDVRITQTGATMRRFKIDELPQLWNVVRGEMSFVGPRPDVPGYADRLTGADRVVLSVRPGITGPAALAFRHEEELLASVEDPARYNDEVIWPEKVRMNRDYVENYSFRRDLRCIGATLMSIVQKDPAVSVETKEGSA